MLARIAFTVVVIAIAVWLLASGKPLGGLLIVPAIAVWARHAVEEGRLRRLGRRSHPRS